MRRMGVISGHPIFTFFMGQRVVDGTLGFWGVTSLGEAHMRHVSPHDWMEIQSYG